MDPWSLVEWVWFKFGNVVASVYIDARIDKDPKGGS
jgi:hypothetical protein